MLLKTNFIHANFNAFKCPLMFDVLKTYLSQRAVLTKDQFDLIESLVVELHLNKGDLLQREGDIAKYGAFVTKGCLRSYVVDDKGKEHVVQFAPETWWLTDLNSLINGVPSLYFMDALEPTDVLLLDKSSNSKLLQQIPAFAAAFNAGQQKHTFAKDQRIIASLKAPAEERYQNFLRTYPSIAQRVPQHMLASYIGVSPETLSRIRKRWAQKN